MGSTAATISEEMSVNRLVNPRKRTLPPTKPRRGHEVGRGTATDGADGLMLIGEVHVWMSLGRLLLHCGDCGLHASREIALHLAPNAIPPASWNTPKWGLST